MFPFHHPFNQGIYTMSQNYAGFSEPLSRSEPVTPPKTTDDYYPTQWRDIFAETESNQSDGLSQGQDSQHRGQPTERGSRTKHPEPEGAGQPPAPARATWGKQEHRSNRE
jgi:hypothetical protein